MTAPQPPLPSMNRAADESTTLLEMLEYYRTVLLRKTWGLTAEQLDTTVPPSDLTLGGLLLHMALVEDSWFDEGFAGNDQREPWASAPWDEDRDWDFHAAGEWSHQELVSQFEESVARSRRIVEEAASLDQPLARRDSINLRWVLVHMIEEYARHCGHADLIRESIDGATGD